MAIVLSSLLSMIPMYHRQHYSSSRGLPKIKSPSLQGRDTYHTHLRTLGFPPQSPRKTRHTVRDDPEVFPSSPSEFDLLFLH